MWKPVRRSFLFLSLAALLSGVAFAQLAAPNAAGVAMGHVHLTVNDVEADKKLWIELGGTSLRKYGNDEVIGISGMLVILKKGAPSGGSEGSVVNHIAVRVPHVQESVARWQAAGVKTEPGSRPTEGWVITPDGLRIQVLEDASLTTPIAMDHMQFSVEEASLPQIEAWYVKTFGVKPDNHGTIKNGDLPGAHLHFRIVDTAALPTKGRTLDHIGFEIKDLETFCKKLEANGVKIERPYAKRPDLGAAIAFISDPWGTYIDLTEGMNHR